MDPKTLPRPRPLKSNGTQVETPLKMGIRLENDSSNPSFQDIFRGFFSLLVSGKSNSKTNNCKWFLKAYWIFSFASRNKTGWWQLKCSIFIFTPKIREDEPIWRSIFFKRGWFNHQLEHKWHNPCILVYFRTLIYLFGIGKPAILTLR